MRLDSQAIDKQRKDLDQTQLSRPIGLYFGFGAMLALMGFITVVGFLGMEKIQNRAEIIVSDRMEKMQLVVQMRAAARERTVLLQRMILLDDPFERDDEFMLFNRQGAIFAQARLSLLNSPLSKVEKDLLNSQGKITGIGVPQQNKIVDLVAQDEMEQAQTLLVEQSIPLQDSVLTVLTELYEYQRQAAADAVVEAENANHEARVWMLWLSAAAGVIGIIIAVFVGKRTSQASSAREKYMAEIKYASEAKSSFLANMSHEIRTPLTAIIGFAEASLDSDQSPEERLGAFRTIVRSGKHLLQIINDILDLSKVEADKLEVERIPLSPFQIIADVESIVRMQALDKGLDFKIKYDFPLPSKIESDPIRLKQILINLCSNAIKFTHCGRVQINLNCNSDEQLLRFSVIDSGIGLNKEQITKIFSAFTQADSSTTRKYGGTGLGLSLSKRLAEMLGGTLEVISEPDIGSRFDLIVATGSLQNIKLVRAVSEISVSQEIVVAQVERNSLMGEVLLAEDTIDNQNLLSMYLRKMGANVTIVENGKLAVEAALQNEYDMICMDMQMPVMDGITAVSLLREKGYKRPIIALTANAMNEDRVRCLQAGCNDFVTKPVDRTRLYNVTKSYLRQCAQATEVVPIVSTLLSDEPEFQDLVEEYIRKIPHMVDELDLAAKNENWDQVRFLAHKLRGTGGGFGFQILTDFASKLGYQVHNKNYLEATNLISELRVINEQIQKGASQAIRHAV